MRSILILGLCIGSVDAQQHVTIPRSVEFVDAAWSRSLLGPSGFRRQQILVDDVHLSSLRERPIRSLTLRRDAGYPEQLQSGQLQLIVRIGASPNPAAEASRTMRDNLPSPTEVFRGIVSFPRSPASTGLPSWSADNTISIPFSSSYSHTAGHLCVEMEITGTPFWWPLDAAFDPVAGTEQPIGQACGPYVDLDGWSSWVAPEELVIGETARFVSRGTPGAPGFMLFGITLLSQPLDLAVVGAPGCKLYVDPLAAYGTTFLQPEVGASVGGLGNVLAEFPAQPVLTGSRFVIQWIDLGPTLRTSNAIRCELANAAPVLGMSLVVQDEPDGPIDVDVTMAPVLRFGF